MVKRDNAITLMLRDPSAANKRELVLKQRKAKQITRKKQKNVGESQNRNHGK